VLAVALLATAVSACAGTDPGPPTTEPAPSPDQLLDRRADAVCEVLRSGSVDAMNLELQSFIEDTGELGFTAQEAGERLRERCPDGVDRLLEVAEDF
jgi:hypothetical protein